MENPTYLGDAVYAHFNGYSVELKLDDHRNPTVVTLEPEVLAALNRFYKNCTTPHEEPGDPKAKLVRDELRGFRSELEEGIALCDKVAIAMLKLPAEVIPNCCILHGALIIYHQEREGVLSIISALNAGKWEKNINHSNPTRLDYKAVVDGVNVEIWNAAPPEGCKIIEEEIEVPAHTEIMRKLVCR